MKSKLGDVFEIGTCVGLAYAQYTHHEDSYGELIRVFDELCSKRPKDISQVVRGRVRFSTFFPLASALRQKVIHRISNEAISAANQGFPWFRYGIPNPSSGKVEKWFLWRGGDEYIPIELFTIKHRRLSILGLWNFPMLLERLQEKWRPEDYY